LTGFFDTLRPAPVPMLLGGTGPRDTGQPQAVSLLPATQGLGTEGNGLNDAAQAWWDWRNANAAATWQHPENLVLGFGGIMAGPKALTADLAALARAREMQTAGRAMEDIRADTGWFEGPKLPGKNGWRFEIPDQEAVYRPGGVVAELKRQGIPDPWQSQTGFAAPVRDFMSHRELFDAYPELGNKILYIDPTLKEQGYLGTYGTRWGPDTLSLNTEIAPRPEGGKSVLLHELMHGVQRIEDFPRGGNPTMPEVRNVVDAEIKERLADLDARMNSYQQFVGNFRNQYEAKHGDRPGGDWFQEFRRLYPEMVNEQGRLFDEWHTLNSGPGRNALYQEGYHRLFGEIEARDVQARMNMDPVTRMLAPPYASQGIPRSRYIIRGE